MNKQNVALQVNKMCIAAMLLALCWLMPFLTLNDQALGNMLSLMHIPVFISGFVLGPIYGAFIGFIAPLTRMLMFGAPPLIAALPMAFELLTYGFISGLIYLLFIKKNKSNKLDSIIFIYVALIIAMILGRGVGGLVKYLCVLGGMGDNFTFSMFITTYFVTPWPGLIIQLVLIPALIRLLYELNLIQKFMPKYDFRNRKFKEESSDLENNKNNDNNEENSN